MKAIILALLLCAPAFATKVVQEVEIRIICKRTGTVQTVTGASEALFARMVVGTTDDPAQGKSISITPTLTSGHATTLTNFCTTVETALQNSPNF